jgi:hypothetical protein
MTLRGMKRISFATPSTARTTWMSPPRMTAAIRWSRPWSLVSGATTRATAPVAALIIAGRPPVKAMVTAIVNEANRPTRGSTPARIENEIASGINASATTSPARTSVRSTRGDESQTGRDSRGGRTADNREDIRLIPLEAHTLGRANLLFGERRVGLRITQLSVHEPQRRLPADPKPGSPPRVASSAA